METTAAQYPVRSSGLTQTKHGSQGHLSIPQLTALAARGLVQMFDTEKQLFCFRLKRSKRGLIREGLSHRYTIISLLGLHQLEMTGIRSPIEIRPPLETLLKDTGWLTNLGDLGLLLWLCALARVERVNELCEKLDVQRALSRYRDAREVRTMELAWFLSGLSHQDLAQVGKSAGLAALAVKTFRLLKNNEGGTGTFGHLAREASLAGPLRGRIGSFADQVYPIYALARFAQAYGSKEALAMASNCAEAICRVQGPLGQWWWHYDSATGKVAGKYPVYSVHQDGMAPMALYALGEASGQDFSGPIFKGLRWIYGENEQGVDMRDASANVIWRSIHPANKFQMYIDDLFGMMWTRRNSNTNRDVAILYECWPYELGWLLYAFGGRAK